MKIGPKNRECYGLSVLYEQRSPIIINALSIRKKNQQQQQQKIEFLLDD